MILFVLSSHQTISKLFPADKLLTDKSGYKLKMMLESIYMVV